jgi:hypothetical protein
MSRVLFRAPDPITQRKTGHCPLTAKEAAHMLAAFGVKRHEDLSFLEGLLKPCLVLWFRAPDPTTQRKTGQCPLTPEEAVLMLAALGVKRRTRIYLTTAEVWGGQDRLIPLKGLYPYFVTKEQLASPEELAPFRNSLPKVRPLLHFVSIHSLLPSVEIRSLCLLVFTLGESLPLLCWFLSFRNYSEVSLGVPALSSGFSMFSSDSSQVRQGCSVLMNSRKLARYSQ